MNKKNKDVEGEIGWKFGMVLSTVKKGKFLVKSNPKNGIRRICQIRFDWKFTYPFTG